MKAINYYKMRRKFNFKIINYLHYKNNADSIANKHPENVILQTVNRIAKSVNRKPDWPSLRFNPSGAVVFKSAFLLTTPDAIFVHSIRSVYVSVHPVSNPMCHFDVGLLVVWFGKLFVCEMGSLNRFVMVLFYFFFQYFDEAEVIQVEFFC